MTTNQQIPSQIITDQHPTIGGKNAGI